MEIKQSLLKYPFDAQIVMKKRKSIKKDLLASDKQFLEKKIAILGGSTTHDIKEMLELFLLENEIKPTFYESEYGQYWQDVMFDNDILGNVRPDIIVVHTSNRNIMNYPSSSSGEAEVNNMIKMQYEHFEEMWNTIRAKYACPIIQNNFEMPFYRLLGNKDSSDIHGRTNYIMRLNMMFSEYAQKQSDFFINDINYLSASYGLEKWSDPLYWYMYKYCLCIPAIPMLGYSISNIIKSIYGKNKKAIILDLDNTMWDGVVGEDGVKGIDIGHETAMGQAYSEFQNYIKKQKQIGVLLAVNSKNDYDKAIEGLNHPEGTLKPEDFIVIKANWNDKDKNICEIAIELNLLPESFVFVDDNPVERDIVLSNNPGIAAPYIGKIENYIRVIDKAGYFEVTNLSEDDIKRNEMYKVDLDRMQMRKKFSNYKDYLLSLDMKAQIRDFDSIYIPRIAQLTNKVNQFNLTTKRYSQKDIEIISSKDSYIRLYGKLKDKFGDNGVTTVVSGKKDGPILHIELWLMSCRIIKRDMEHAMLDSLVKEAIKYKISTIIGYYYKTPKNGIVKDFYKTMGFTLTEQKGEDTVWEIKISDYQNLNHVIKIETE